MIKRARRTIVLQQDTSDCGVASILSIINFYGGTNNLENLRALSGTDEIGTTMLGMVQCAEKVGLEAEVYEAEIANLKQLSEISILLVSLDNGLNHYIVLYKYDIKKGRFIIGDPAKGVIFWDDDQLLSYWKSKMLLIAKPSKSFKRRSEQRSRKMGWLRVLIKEDVNILLTASFIGTFIAALGLSTALFTQKLIDEIIPKHQIHRLIYGLILLVTLLIVRAILNYVRTFFLLVQAQDFNKRITGNFIDKLVLLPKLFFDTRKIGDLIARLNDTMRIQKTIAYLSGTFIIDLLIIIISSAYLFYYNNTVGFIMLSFLPIMGFLTFIFNKEIITNNRDMMVAYAANESNYIDVISGIYEIKSFNKEKLFISKMISVFNLFQGKNFKLGRTGNKFNIVIETTSSIIIVVILGLVSYLVITGRLKIGEMMAILSISISLVPTFTRIMLTNLQLQEADVAFDRMFEFASVEPEKNAIEIGSSGWNGSFSSLKTRNLRFNFPGHKNLLRDINLTIEKGKLTHISGKSGSGKSTLLQILQRFQPVEDARIIINENFFLNQIPLFEWRKKIAIVRQEVKLFNCTIIENICLSNQPDDFEGVLNLCQSHDMIDYFNQFPKGFYTQLGEDGIKLSGGQKQIVALMRALFKKPQLLLLDEITASVDPEMEAFVLQLLDNLKSSMAIVLISHKISSRLIADYNFIIEDGISKPC